MAIIEASEENVKLSGRYIIKNGITWLVQSGSAAEFIVTGKQAWLILAGDKGIHQEQEYRPRYGVFADDRLIADKTMDKPEETVKLFSGNCTVTQKIKVIMLSEAEYGAVGVKHIDSSEDISVNPAPEKGISIEFIGDSITCAYGVEGKDFNEPFCTSTENFTCSYAYLTALKLNADCSAVCYSGHGVVSAYTSGEKDDKRLVPKLYDIASKLPEYAEKWDFGKHKNDIVVINLGTNDSSYITAYNRIYFDERIKEFTEGYIAFIKDVRIKNKDSYIICTIGTMDNDDIHSYVEEAVSKYKNETKDSRIMFYHSELQDPNDGYGCAWHPSKVTHQKLAEGLVKQINDVLIGV